MECKKAAAAAATTVVAVDIFSPSSLNKPLKAQFVNWSLNKALKVCGKNEKLMSRSAKVASGKAKVAI